MALFHTSLIEWAWAFSGCFCFSLRLLSNREIWREIGVVASFLKRVFKRDTSPPDGPNLLTFPFYAFLFHSIPLLPFHHHLNRYINWNPHSNKPFAYFPLSVPSNKHLCFITAKLPHVIPQWRHIHLFTSRFNKQFDPLSNFEPADCKNFAQISRPIISAKFLTKNLFLHWKTKNFQVSKKSFLRTKSKARLEQVQPASKQQILPGKLNRLAVTV